MKPRALIVGDRRRAGIRAGVDAALPILRERLDVVGVDLDDGVDLANARADVVLVFGGDGSFLHVAHRLGTNPLPVLGVNYGRFGYLAELEPDALEEGVDAFVAGRFAIAERARLRCAFVRDGRRVVGGLALNDVVLGRVSVGRTVDVDVRIDGRGAFTLVGDGLIVATATGSTAHALSAGGPILEPTVPGVLIVPICPHALGARPLVVPLSSRIEMVQRSRRAKASVTIDGRTPRELAPGEVVEIADAGAPLRVVTLRSRSIYDTLREKLGWAAALAHRERADGEASPDAEGDRGPRGVRGTRAP